jgi:uncharacterized lipoprotein YajG
MKILTLISTVVLSCLILAAPAAAEPTITVTPHEVVPGQAITYQVSGVTVENIYTV